MQLRDLIGQLTQLAIDYEYDNIDEYSQYIAKKLEKSINYQRQALEENHEPAPSQ
jgi:hypothetical protein